MILGKHHQLTLNQLNQLVKINQGKVSDLETISKSIVRILQNAVQFDGAWVIKVIPGSLNIENIYLYHFSQNAFSRYLDEYYTNTPVPTIRQVKQEGFVSRKGSHLIENKVWVQHPFYKNILEPIGLHFFL
ncbi:MAG TPA: hypothetical protein VN944_02680, partial [Nitrospiria bacterium]|nr:hypothetical protein [Nitrospiria bacterium]